MRQYKIVPVEPTEEMQNAWADCNHEETAHGDWKVMLAVAPPASQDEVLVGRMAETMCDTFNAYNAWDCYSNDDKEEWRQAARAVLKMLEADHG